MAADHGGLYGVLFPPLLEEGALAQKKALRCGRTAACRHYLPRGIRWASFYRAAMGAGLRRGAAYAFGYLSRSKIKDGFPVLYRSFGVSVLISSYNAAYFYGDSRIVSRWDSVSEVLCFKVRQS